MDLRVSSPKPDLSPSDSVSDPGEKDISDDEDDDRNHKHRRRETESQSFERDHLEQASTMPYRKRNKPFENGHSYREASSQSNQTWRNYNISSVEKDLSGKFDKRRPDLAPISRGPFDLNQRIRLNQSLSGEPGSGRGRGRASGPWSQHDSRFSSFDFNSNMVQQGPLPSSLFAGRGMPAVTNSQSASWGAYGLVTGLPNGGLDTLHPLVLQRTRGAPINPSINIGIPRQRCRDFEERGFCLRGDMCPMEHGVNRIVIDDVQSLSEFNLPVSLPSALLVGAAAGSAPLSAISAPSSALVNSKGFSSKSSRSGVDDGGLGSYGAFNGSDVADGADFYDPDQPLWTNHPTKVGEVESLLDADPSAGQHIGLYAGSNNERSVKSTGTVLGSQSTSLPVLGRIGSSKVRPEMREKIESTISTSNYTGSTTKQDLELLNNAQGAAFQGKQINADEINLHATDKSLKTMNDTGHTNRKPYQKAQCTLFVNGIPQKNNKKEVLLSHFRKFGEVVDIYIPLNSERAFVQFSKREEAEDALKAPDAVMGNRFIKLWWANRDSIPSDGLSGGNSLLVASRLVTVDSIPDCSVVANIGKPTPHSAAPKGSIPIASVIPVPAFAHSKPMDTNGAVPPTQKKLETLEVMKEELRKKQEMLDQKRNDFRQKLDKLEKQKATGLKGDVASVQAVKRHKLGTVTDATKAATPISIDPSMVVASSRAEMTVDSVENIVPQISKINTMVVMQETSNLKQSIRPLAPAGAPFVMNRFKLDNRPTSFKIIPPLPTGLANVAVLKEHFSTFGELSTVNLEDVEFQDGGDESVTSKSSARLSFTTRHSAERAFLNGKCWKGHNLQFMWLTSSNSNDSGRDNPSSSSKGSSDANALPAGEVASTVSPKTAVSGDVESEVPEKRETGPEFAVANEEFQFILTAISTEKQSPPDDIN